MEFRAKLVVGRKNKKAYVAYAGLFIAFLSLLMVFIPGQEDHIAITFGIGVIVIVIGAILAKGDVTNYALSEEELQITATGITIASQYYPLNQVTNMDFDVQAYDGRYMNDGAMISGTSSDGMTNQLRFDANGKTIKCGFYLTSKMHVIELGQIFDQFYQNHIPFVEHNKSTRTYLFQILNDKQLVEFKSRYGY
ncbi:hypothetical protein ACX0G9_15865 [Flavitalea flava]